MKYFSFIIHVLTTTIFRFLSSRINIFKLFLNTGRFYNVRIFGSIRLFVHPKGNIFIGKNVRFNSGFRNNAYRHYMKMTIVVHKGAYLVIEDNVGISNSTIICKNRIVISKNVLIGGGCVICDSDLHPLNTLDRINSRNEFSISLPIFIRENAFIGGGSTILKGVSIGENSIVGACSLVSKSVIENSISGGNPCRFIRNISEI